MTDHRRGGPGTTRPRAALVTPVAPQRSGNGLAMRASVLADALAVAHEVDVIVASPRVPPGPGPDGGATDRRPELMAWLADPDVRELLRATLPWPADCRLGDPDEHDGIRRRLDGDLAVVVVFRARSAPWLLGSAAFTGPTRLVLDLDDDEVSTHRRLAELARQLGDEVRAAEHDDAGAAHGRYLTGWSPRFDEVWVASPIDAGVPGVRQARVVPNAVDRPQEDPTPNEDRRAREATARLVFVGNLTYAPNEDAAVRLATEILPRVASILGRPVGLDLVGRPSPAVDALARRPGVVVHGAVADLDPVYAGDPVVAVPLRAGGGTRLKVLEAFARGVEVVATPLAVEGLAVTPALEATIVDADPDLFAAACAAVLDRAPDDARLAAARALVATNHDRTLVVRETAAIIAALTSRPSSGGGAA